MGDPKKFSLNISTTTRSTNNWTIFFKDNQGSTRPILLNINGKNIFESSSDNINGLKFELIRVNSTVSMEITLSERILSSKLKYTNGVAKYNFTIQPDGCVGKDYSINVRYPIQMVFLLDKSGSMGTKKKDTRWKDLTRSLKDANFINKLTSQLRRGDEFGIISFNGNATKEKINDNFLVKFDRTQSKKDFIKELEDKFDSINDFEPDKNDGTSFGAAIREYFVDEDYLNYTVSDSIRQIVVLLTDGKEGVFPKISTSTTRNIKWNLITRENKKEVPLRLTINGTEVDFSDRLLSSLRGNKVEFFPVGVDEKSNSLESLKILTNTDSAVIITSRLRGKSRKDKIIDNLNNLIEKVYQNSSPRFIKVESQLESNSNTFSFTCNRNVNSLFIDVFYSNNSLGKRSLVIRKKDDTSLPSTTAITIVAVDTLESINSKQFVFNFNSNQNLNSEGEWEIISENQSLIDQFNLDTSNTVSFTAMADDNKLTINAYPNASDVAVGRDISPTVSVVYEGIPIENADVKVSVKRPGDDLETLLANVEIDMASFNSLQLDEGILTEEGYEEGKPLSSTLKLVALERDALTKTGQNGNEILEKFKDGIVSTKKFFYENGIYRGTFRDLQVSGIYELEYNITAGLGKNDTIVRQIRQNIFVEDAKYLLSSSDIAVLETSLDSIVIEIKPTFSRPDNINAILGNDEESSFFIDDDQNLTLEKVNPLGFGKYRLLLIPKDDQIPKQIKLNISNYDLIIDLEPEGNSPELNLIGRTTVFLEGRKSITGKEETNFGNLLTDAYLEAAKNQDNNIQIAFTHSNDINKEIGEILEVNPSLKFKIPPQADPVDNKNTGEIFRSHLDNSLLEDFPLVILYLSPVELKKVLEHSVSQLAFPFPAFLQVSGFRFAYDAAKEVNNRVELIDLIDSQGDVIQEIYSYGLFAEKAPDSIGVVTNEYIAKGREGFPFNIFPNLTVMGVEETSKGIPLSGKEALKRYLRANYSITPFSMAETPVEEDRRIIRLGAQRSSIERVAIIDTESQKNVGKYSDLKVFETINLSELPEDQRFTFQAYPESEEVKSVSFSIDDLNSESEFFTHSPSQAPFTAFGEEENRLLPWTLGSIQDGDIYNLQVTPFERENAKGIRGETFESTLLFFDIPLFSAEVTTVFLVDAETDEFISPIVNGSQISLSQASKVNIVTLTNPEKVGSMFLELEGPAGNKVVRRTENIPPYALFGDKNGNYSGRSLKPGNYTLSAIPYEGRNRNGNRGKEVNIPFSILEESAVFSISPNPTADFLTVSSDSLDETPNIQLFTLQLLEVSTGKVVYSKQVSSTFQQDIDMSQWDNGLYAVQLIKGNEVISRKVWKN